jgi:hypothetical protein
VRSGHLQICWWIKLTKITDFSGIILSLSGILVTEFILDYLVLNYVDQMEAFCCEHGMIYTYQYLVWIGGVCSNIYFYYVLQDMQFFLFQFLHANRHELLYNHSS